MSTKDELILRLSGRYPPRKTTIMDHSEYKSIQLKAILVLTTNRIKDPSRRRKGEPTSLASSTTAIARKATIRTNMKPGSRVINYRTLDIVRMDSVLRRVRPRITRILRFRTKLESS